MKNLETLYTHLLILDHRLLQQFPVSAENFAYNPNIFFFIQGFPAFVGPQGIFIIINCGFRWYIISYFSKFEKKL